MSTAKVPGIPQRYVDAAVAARRNPQPPDGTPRGRLPWRVGASVGRTLYDADEILIGFMDTEELAALVVAAVNTGEQL